MGMGLGRALIEYVLKEFSVSKVDVNEQNDQAVLFYEKMGFMFIGRSETDGLGLPYPIVHMALNKGNFEIAMQVGK